MFAVLTNGESGGTFLTWTIHYLRGDTQYFLVERNKFCNITDNPLTGNNAHNFIPNQPNRVATNQLQKLHQIISKLKTTDKQGIVYMHSFVDPESNAQGVKHVCEHIDKKILVSNKNLPYFHVNYSHRGNVWVFDSEYHSDDNTAHNKIVDTYFSNSKQHWQDLDLTTIWDKREFAALNFNFKTVEHIENYVDRASSHYLLDAIELYNSKNFINDMFGYLELPIDQSRHDRWQSVYQDWQKFFQHRTLFSLYFTQIIDYILNGYDLDLSKFNLDIMQEAAIQSHLIFNHNLNFKTWQLEKFTNTKQLHQLLESNPHNINLYKHLH